MSHKRRTPPKEQGNHFKRTLGRGMDMRLVQSKRCSICLAGEHQGDNCAEFTRRHIAAISKQRMKGMIAGDIGPTSP